MKIVRIFPKEHLRRLINEIKNQFSRIYMSIFHQYIPKIVQILSQLGNAYAEIMAEQQFYKTKITS